MKTLRFTALAVAALSILWISCAKQQTQDDLFSKGTFDFSGILEDTDFDNAEITNKADLKELAEEMADFIYVDEIKEETIYISKRKNSWAVGKRIANTQKALPRSKRCPEESITCRSRQCIVDQMEEIMGDGSRDVEITYERGMFGATLTWAYLDC